jgi:hypothetical protein
MRDPLSPMSFSRVTKEVQAMQDNTLALYAKGMRTAFSPLGLDGKPLRRSVILELGLAPDRAYSVTSLYADTMTVSKTIGFMRKRTASRTLDLPRLYSLGLIVDTSPTLRETPRPHLQLYRPRVAAHRPNQYRRRSLRPAGQEERRSALVTLPRSTRWWSREACVGWLHPPQRRYRARGCSSDIGYWILSSNEHITSCFPALLPLHVHGGILSCMYNLA